MTVIDVFFALIACAAIYALIKTQNKSRNETPKKKKKNKELAVMNAFADFGKSIEQSTSEFIGMFEDIAHAIHGKSVNQNEIKIFTAALMTSKAKQLLPQDDIHLALRLIGAYISTDGKENTDYIAKHLEDREEKYNAILLDIFQERKQESVLILAKEVCRHVFSLNTEQNILGENAGAVLFPGIFGAILQINEEIEEVYS